MRRLRQHLGCFVAVLITSLGSTAAAQVKPRFVIAFDTSGSMAFDLPGNTTYGDGVGRPKQVGDAPALVRDGIFYGCGTTAGLDRDCNGFPDDSRIAVAKSAVRKMVAGFGAVEWALMRFHQTGTQVCATYGGSNSCGAAGISYGNPQCNSGAVDNVGCVGAIPDSCEPGKGTTTSLKLWSATPAPGDFNGCINYTGSCTGGDVLVGFPDMGPFVGLDNRNAILKWMDNVETAYDSGTTVGNFCNGATTGDCELRPSGSTPLAGILSSALSYVSPIRTADTASACRPYSVILVTDGAESCNGTPDTQAASLLSAGVLTYVVGVSITPSEQTSLNAIAAAGGTTNAYFANSPTQLSAALSTIVSNSLRFETCNGLDDDCDGNIDEDLPSGQPGADPQPSALFCDREAKRSGAQNTQVRARSDYSDTLLQSVPLPAAVVCGRVVDGCDDPGVDDDCDGAIDEDGTLNSCGSCPGAPDICNGLDDDCDGFFDETDGSGQNFSVCPSVCTRDLPCGSNVGQCEPGVYRCSGGVLDISSCVGAVGPSTEVCDEIDNDCDGTVDDPVELARACTTAYGSVGICRPGTQYCAKPSVGEHADGSGYLVDAQNHAICVGQVLPDDRELCDSLDHDCDGNPFTCTSPTCTIHPQPAFVGSACGLGVGICTGVLQCDQDGNPDGGPPVLVCSAPSAGTEICNGLDDDCDGSVDEQAALGPDLGAVLGGPSGAFCGTEARSAGVCNPGAFACINGHWQCRGEIGPGTEICNGLDDDCDGNTDESGDLASFDPRLGQQCGTSVGECEPGFSVCTAGEVTCTPLQGPVDEDCDGLDNDCDNLTDEDLPVTPTSCGLAVGTCTRGQIACIAVPTSVDADGFDYVCQGGVGPAYELCDGADNDCDGAVDECSGDPGDDEYQDCQADPLGPLGAGGGGACGADNPACQRGRLKCSEDADGMGSPGLVCVGADYGTPESCNSEDDDCDLKIDESVELSDVRVGARCGEDQVGPCRTDVDSNGIDAQDPPCGLCRFGAQQCIDGELVCIGTVGPAAYEHCNRSDDDCDGDVDECVDLSDPSCAPGEVDPDTLVGTVCGEGDCSAGVNRCVNGVLECEGLQQGGDEVCDTLDNDCDGSIDEGFQINALCGPSEGECKPGHLVCDPDNVLRTLCVDAIGPSDELCDDLDNDCNGTVDDLPPGEACGLDVGLCKPGTTACVSGNSVCSGSVAAAAETCDCQDNDCDGAIDEATGASPICPGGSTCTMCQCALPCVVTVEFAAQCPQGKTPITQNGACYCVGELCNATRCGQQVIEQDGQTQCAPQSTRVGACLCRNNVCTFQCAGVDCGQGLVCDPTDGRCKQKSCLLSQFRCPDEQRCALVDGLWECVADPCASSPCGAGEACRDGACFASCGNLTCPADQRCEQGACVADACANVRCEGGTLCNPADGSCVAPGACAISGCPQGNVCNRVSGECGVDPCLSTRCPQGDRCNSVSGECEAQCSGSLLLCGAECIDPRSSRTHCGASGDCIGSRGGVQCTTGLVCSDGQCTTRCSGKLINCGGECIDPNTDAQHCGASANCQAEHAGKACSAPEECKAGSCLAPGQTPVVPRDTKTRVLASGAGGCACNAVGLGGEPGSSRGAWAGLGLGLLLAGLLRRRARKLVGRGWLLVLLCSVGSATQAGCKVDSFCLDCPQPDASQTQNPPPDAGPGTTRDSGPGTGPGGDGAVGGDAQVGDAQVGAEGGPGQGPDGSTVTPDAGCAGPELCNGQDDDCDGKIDEELDLAALGIDLQTDSQHCGACGTRCALEHAFNQCVAGSCRIDRTQGDHGCDIGFSDLDGEDQSGCEYACTKLAGSVDDSVCDRLDNDCDGHIDENVDLQTDTANCGACGVRCRFAHAQSGAHCVLGQCVLDSAACDDEFKNLDGRDANGCEHHCFRWPPAPELCNGQDDDCDNATDEDVATTDSAVGVACSNDVGACVAGRVACVNGQRVCQGGVGAAREVCDGVDNDCDGITDTDQPEIGLPCGEARPGSQCSKGTLQIPPGGCTGGVERALQCVGGQGPVPELCDGLDNDCDGHIDEDSMGVGQACRNTSNGLELLLADPPEWTSATICRTGVASCESGHLVCRNEVPPQAVELCDALDQDCDGDPLNGFTPDSIGGTTATTGPDARVGKSCDIDTGECSFGVRTCHLDSMTLSCDGGTSPVPELCDGRDNDCDGRIDEHDRDGGGHDIPLPSEGVACVTDAQGVVDTTPPASASVGQCHPGTTVCAAGRIGCQGQISPSPELCDGLDQDCDGDPINGVALTDPSVGRACGPASIGVCRTGVTVCSAGSPPSVTCQGALPNPNFVAAVASGTPEIACDGADNDCDGVIDEGDPLGYDGSSCCDLVGFSCCVQGTMQCSNGRVRCIYPQGAQMPTLEVCNELDDDCDGHTDEGFNTDTDVAHCGDCGHACTFSGGVVDGHAVLVCEDGSCGIGACVGNYVDRDGDYANGCEVPCTFTGNETCDGTDNDCNGVIDDIDVIPSVQCLRKQVGVCDVPQLLTLGPRCTAGTLSCDVAAVVTAGFIHDYEADEVTCDGLDNDCDGAVDEMLPSVGQPCARGTGACRTTGAYACDSGDPSGYSCNAATPPAGTPELCDGLDNDCNGVIDDFASPSASNAVPGFEFVDLGDDTGNTLAMTYEASRPDASDTSAGHQTQKPCSVDGVRPWSNVTWDEANTACCALNASGTCAGDGQGWRLCDSSTWKAMCRGPGATCDYGYSDDASAVCDHDPRLTTFADVCAGAEALAAELYACDPGETECATVNASPTFAECRAVWPNGDIYDLSGNVQEWTHTAPSAGIYQIRGGGYDAVESGRACDFDFVVGSSSFRFPTTGFRCCWYPPAATVTGEECTTYSETSLPLVGPGTGTPAITSQINVPMVGSGVVSKVRVLNLTGTMSRVGELEFQLRSPAGTTIMMINNRCTTIANWAFDLQDGSTLVTNASFCSTTPVGNNINTAWGPEEPFSTFAGQSDEGAWSLLINDTTGSTRAATLTGFSLEICRRTYNYVIP